MKIKKIRHFLLVLLLAIPTIACSSVGVLFSKTPTQTAITPTLTLTKPTEVTPRPARTSRKLTRTATLRSTKKPESTFTQTTTATVEATSTPTLTFTATPPPTATVTSTALAPSPTVPQIPTITPTATGFFAYGQKLSDVTYCTMDGSPQKLDFYFPDQVGPWPVVVYIHGGGWTSGDKSDGAATGKWLSQLGYVVVSINYRMYPEVYSPAFIQDSKCAIRFLRARAGRYGLNPQKIAVWGISAGGHLAALLGTADQSAGFDVGEYPGQSSRVQAVIDVSGPSDLTVAGTPNLEPLIHVIFGPDPAGRVAASPVTYATADDPPFLIVHGDKDEVVAVQQGRAMYKALIAAGAPAKLVIVKNGVHGPGSKPTIPTQAEVAQMMLDFLDEILKGS